MTEYNLTDYERFVDIIYNKAFTKENKRFVFEFLLDIEGLQIVLHSLKKRVYINTRNQIVVENLK